MTAAKLYLLASLHSRSFGTGFLIGILTWLALIVLGVEAVPGVGPLTGRPLVFPLVGISAGLLACNSRRWVRGLFWSGAGVVGALLLLVATTPWMSWLLPRSTGDPLAFADAVYVCGTSILPDGTPAASMQPRLLQGYELLGQGLAPRLIIPRLRPPAPSYAPVVRRQLTDLGLDRKGEELIETVPVRDTYDEAVAVARLYRERGWRRLILVTSPVHLHRAAAVFRKQELVVLARPALEGNYSLSGSTQPEQRIQAFRNWIREVIGYQVYLWRGWI